MMDGRDYGPPRSVHAPPPLLSMDRHQVGAGPTSGRMAPASGHLSGGLQAPLPQGKYLSSGLGLHGHPGEAFSSNMSQYLGGLVASGLGTSSVSHGNANPLSSDQPYRSVTPTNLQMVHDLWAAHSHEGFSHLASGLYPYIPLNQLESSTNGNPLLAQLGQHSLYEAQKDGFYLPGHAGQSALHPQAPISRTMANHTSSSHMREKDLSGHKSAKDSAKERTCRSELSLPYGKKDGKPKEEPRPRSVVDLTQDCKPDAERKLSGLERAIKHVERLSPFHSEHMPNRGPNSGELKSKNPLQTSLLSNCNSGGDALGKVVGAEHDRCTKDARHDENMRPSAHSHMDRTKRCDSVVTSVGSLHVPYSCPSPHTSQQPTKMVSPCTFPPQTVHSSMCTIFPHAKEPGREHKVIAPTFVPSVEAYDERIGPIQIASQARDTKGKDHGKVGMMHSPGEKLLSDSSRPHSQEYGHSDAKSSESVREKSSVIRSNSVVMKRPATSESFSHRSGLGSPEHREFLASKDMVKQSTEMESRSCDREHFQRSCSKESSKVYGTMDASRQHLDHAQLKLPEQKWKPFEMGNFATTQMAVLAAQHNHANRVEEDTKKAYLDSTNLQRSSGGSRVTTEVHHPTSQGEGSAMQSLIKYSGSFAKEAASRQGNGKKSPFGGLGNMKLDQSQLNASKIQQLLSQQGGKNLKRDPERPESAKSFGRESSGSQGDVEVRHPPVGIAVAVARQKDNSSKLGPSLADRDRSLSLSCIKGPGRAEDDPCDDRNRHRDERLLAGRLERDQEKLLRENKELADFARLHPAGCATNGLNSNLMVTGGPSLTGSGRWPVDPASHLGNHHWLPRTGSPSMWLAGHPYGLGHPTLHQGMTPGFAPSMPGSLPSAYQFVRDPQSGQYMVIPAEHMAHFAELMERVPPIWPTMYQPTRSSLQHAHQLQLLSHQQLLRQHELYMLQQQAAHAMELQRNAQLVENQMTMDTRQTHSAPAKGRREGFRFDSVSESIRDSSLQLPKERFKANEQRMELEEKVSKRTSDTTKSLSSSSSGHLQRKSHAVSPSASYSTKAVNSPALSPACSPMAVLKAEVVHKLEEQSTPTAYSYPATPRSQQSSPPLASPPPPTPAIPPKEEAPEDIVKNNLDVEKESAAPFDASFPELLPGYSFQSLPASFRRHYPYLLQPTAAADAEGMAPDVPMSTESPDHLQESPGLKAICTVSSGILDPLVPEAETLEERIKAEVEDAVEQQELCEQRAVFQDDTVNLMEHMDSSGTGILAQQEDAKSVLEQNQKPHQVCQLNYPEEACSKEPKHNLENSSGPEVCPPTVDFKGTLTDTQLEQPDVELLAEQNKLCVQSETKDSDPCRQEECIDQPSKESEAVPDAVYVDEAVHYEIPNLISVGMNMEDPLAGMNALVAATEMPEALSLLAVNNITPTQIDHDRNSLDQTFLQGISLLSEIAEMELAKRQQEMQCLQSMPVRPCLQSLLAASNQMLLEVLAAPTADSLKKCSVRLPRELNPNKKYSWMQKKKEPMYLIKSAIDNMDAMELDYRVKLAELQRRYKEKQRELVKLQRRRDSEDKRDEKSRSLARRGPGRPKKRKHGSLARSPSMERGKNDSKSRKLSKTILLSEDSEVGDGMRREQRLALAEEDEEVESVSGKVKRRNRSWDEYEEASSYSQEVLAKKRKKRQASDQEQLANKLDKALSLTKLDKLKSSFKFTERCTGKEKCGSVGSGHCSKYVLPQETLLDKEEQKKWAKGLHLPFNTSKGVKHKITSKMKKTEVRLKSKGLLKTSHSPTISEVSSYSCNTDSEEDDDSLKDEWPSQSPSSSKMRHCSLYRSAAKKNKATGGFKPAKSGTSATGTQKSKPAVSRKQQFCLLLREAEAGSSFSDTSEDSCEQGY